MFNGMRAVIAAASVLALGAGAAAWSATSASAAPAAPARCTADDLAVWLNASESDDAAGSAGYALEFTNISKTACYLEGYPGVAALDSDGTQRGAAATRETGPVKKVIVAPGATANALLEWAVVQNYPKSTCDPVLISLLTVIGPNNTHADLAYASGLGCLSTKAPYLKVGAIEAGVNLPGFS